MMAAETRKIRTMAARSETMILSMSSPCVDKSKAPRTARKRWIGTAMETMVSPLESTRTIDCSPPLRARATSG